MRSYRQHCAGAKPLDVVGDRWTPADALLADRRARTAPGTGSVAS